MILEAFQGMAWALRPSKMAEITDFLNAWVAGEKKEPTALTGKSGNKSDQPYQIENGIAVIPVYGTISKRMNMFSDISGGTSVELLKRDISSALENPKVYGILLDVESPGGSVDGTKELADFIFESRGKKPIVAYANGLMASAAYWIGSAADAIVANDTAIVGSIGVAMQHVETSANNEKNGVRKTEIYAGKYKRIASSTKPLTEEGKAYLQSMVDAYYSIFVEAVARNRGVTAEKALEMADGKEFIGKQALDMGLVDAIGTKDTALGLIQKRSKKTMDVKILQEQHPDLFVQVKKLGNEEAMQAMTKVKDEAKAEGVKEERQRVTEILSADGDFVTSIECIKNGTSSADSFKRFFEAEKKNRAGKLDAMRKNAPQSVGQELPPAAGSDSETFKDKVEKIVATGKKRSEAIREAAKAFPELYAASVES